MPQIFFPLLLFFFFFAFVQNICSSVYGGELLRGPQTAAASDGKWCVGGALEPNFFRSSLSFALFSLSYLLSMEVNYCVDHRLPLPVMENGVLEVLSNPIFFVPL